MTMPRSTPSAQGVDAAGLLGFLDAVRDRELGLHSLMMARHGRLIAQGWWPPYSADRPHLMYSVSKSITATAVGLLAQEGVLSLDDVVIESFPEFEPDTLHPNWSKVTVRHCLSMTVGHLGEGWDEAFAGTDSEVDQPGTDWLPLVLATSPAADPGSVFAYNQIATYLLSALIWRRTGSGIVAALRDRLLDRFGIDAIPWHTDPQGRELGFTGAHLTTAQLLAFTQFWLDRGRVCDEQVLREEWFDEAAAAFVPPVPSTDGKPDWACGYGYSYWIARHGYRADGAFGQFGIVLPEHDMAIAITGEQDQMQDVLDALWEFVIPAVDSPGSPHTDIALARRMQTDAIATGKPSPSPAADAHGPSRAEFVRSADSTLAEAYTAVRIAATDSGHQVGLNRSGAWLDFTLAPDRWVETGLEADGFRLPVLARGGWINPSHFHAEVLVIESPHRFTIDARLSPSSDSPSSDSPSSDSPSSDSPSSDSPGSESVGSAELRWRLLPLMGPDPFHLAVHRR